MNAAVGGSGVDPKSLLTPLRSLTELTEKGPRRGLHSGELYSGLASSGVAKELTPSNVESLREYSITTVEELIALERIDRPDTTSLLEDLGISPRLVEDLRNAFLSSSTGRQEVQDWTRFERYEYSTGFSLEETGEPVEVTPELELGAMTGAGAPEAEAASLIDTCMPPIRDQGNRGTCTAFASVSCLEYYLCSKQHKAAALSEQFQYWNMVMQTGQHSLIACFPMLSARGVCRDQTWPYYGKEIPDNDAQDPPPPTAMAEAVGYTCLDIQQILPRSVREIQAALRQGRVVAIGIPVYRSWFESPVVRKYGNITLPAPGEVPQRIGHAVALVGFQSNDQYAGGGFFIVRNSWDHYWGSSNTFGSGYGTIPYRYIERFNWDAWCIIR